MEKLLNFIFIPECAFCQKIGSFFCAECLGKCTQIIKEVDYPKARTKFLFGYEYTGLIRECIRNAKYRNKRFAAYKVLAQKVADVLAPKLQEYTQGVGAVILSVPVTKTKLKQRGFNQAELAAQIFSKTSGVTFDAKALVRSKETTSQYANNKVERRENLKDAFSLSNSRFVDGKSVILVDDVCTTGATFTSAVKVLLKAGATQVICVALARKS